MVNSNGVHSKRRVLKYSAISLVLALLAFAAFLVSQSWRETRSDQARQLATIAGLDGIAIGTYFSQLEIGMQSLGADLADERGQAALQKPGLDRAFKLVHRFQKLHTELGNVILIRADGQVLLTGNTPNSPDLPTLAKDSAFMRFRGELLRGPAFVIGQPVFGNIDRSWVVAARYAVTGQDGKLAYIISANLPADLLQRYWTDWTSPRITAMGLIRDDGYLISRYPVPDAASLDKMYGKPADDAMIQYLRAKKYPQSGQVEMPGGGAKSTDLRALRRLQHYPVTLFAEMPMAEIKSAWWDDMHAPYVLMTLLLATMYAFYSVSMRRRRAWSIEQRREELRRNYEQALHERSSNEIFMFDAGSLQFTYANDHALENTGYTLEQLQETNLLALQPGLGIESFAALVEPLRRNAQESATYETVQARRDGSTYPVAVNLQLITSADDGEGFLAIVNDITALRQAEENLRAFNAPVERRAFGRGNDRRAI